MTGETIAPPDTGDIGGLPEELVTDRARERIPVRVLGLVVAHADDFDGVREDAEDPNGFTYVWTGVEMTQDGQRLMRPLEARVGRLLLNFESGRWQVREGGEILSEGYIAFT
ncbi:MAG TPA: hypothetical protein VK943_06365 [Arenibaculum sp.]|nr:hypothetical protein [Arenibaculum sp.]